ncbi:Spc98 family-domain-containing protein [Mortierella sp. GBAus27b]|nr:Spc98 family-domain-containing protein [Mortierella sp. GBAus27b]
MDTSDQVADAVDALVRLQLGRDAQSIGDRMELDDDHDATDSLQEEKLKAAKEYCLRILGSRLTPSLVADDMHISDLIKKKLMRTDATSAKAVRFSHLYTKLSACSVLTKKWPILYFLLAVSDQSSSSAALDSYTDGQPLSYMGLHNLDTTRTRERTNTKASDTSMARTHSQQGSTPLPSQERRPAYADLLDDQRANGQSEVEETALLRDLIFVSQGIDGNMIKFDANAKIFSIDSSVNISVSTRALTTKLAELGWLYKTVNEYVETTLKRETIGTAGLVSQSFCAALQHELTDYFRLVAVLEAHIAKDTENDRSNGLSLKRLLVWTQESMQRLRLMSVLVECCQGLEGGALVHIVHDYTQHGDPLIQQFIHPMLERISVPFYIMMQRWIYEGELEDPRGEFFIACNPDVEEEDMWQRKHYIRRQMLPAFIGDSLARKILSIGKSLNFLRHKCDDGDWLSQNHGVGKSMKYGDIAELEGSIDATYAVISQRLLQLLREKFKLIDHLTAIKRYILLGQGDFVQLLMESLGSSLSQPANTLLLHNLTGTLETAIRGSNAQFDDPEVLRRLDVRTLEASPGDSGWDVFSLDYHVDSPINTILTPAAMKEYLRVSNFLWRLKRVEHSLSSAWRRQTTSARAIRPILELVPQLHHCRIVCSEMIHFVYQLQYYILFGVLECSWADLLKAINNNTTDLDGVIRAHSTYLRDITSKGLLASDNSMMQRLVELLATILDYKVAQDNLYNYALAEIERRDRLTREAERRTRHGQWGLTDEDEALDRIPEEQFQEVVPSLLKTLNQASQRFKQELTDLLIMISVTSDSDLGVPSVGVGLDFNEFYQRSLKGLLSSGKQPTASR